MDSQTLVAQPGQKRKCNTDGGEPFMMLCVRPRGSRSPPANAPSHTACTQMVVPHGSKVLQRAYAPARLRQVYIPCMHAGQHCAFRTIHCKIHEHRPRENPVDMAMFQEMACFKQATAHLSCLKHRGVHPCTIFLPSPFPSGVRICGIGKDLKMFRREVELRGKYKQNNNTSLSLCWCVRKGQCQAPLMML